MRFPEDVPILTSGDVTLRAHRLDDLDALVEQCTDPVSVRWTSVPLGYTPEMGRSYLTESVPRAWQDDTEWNFAIESTPFHEILDRLFEGPFASVQIHIHANPGRAIAR